MTGVTAEDLNRGLKPIDSWWTVLAVDPVATRLLPAVVRVGWLTPNVITLLAAIVGVASALAYPLSLPVVAGLLFELRFFLDCLDGKVARVRRNGSSVGAFLDSAADMVVSTAVFVSAGLWCAGHGPLGRSAALLPAVAALAWNWSNTYAMTSERNAGGEAGRSGRGVESGGLAAALRRRRLTRLPSSVEATTVALFVAPLTASKTVVAAVLLAVTVGFYLPAFLHNMAKAYRAAGRAG